MLDSSKLCYEGDFDTQVTNLLQHVRLTRREVESLTQLFDDLEGALQERWPGCQVLPFGSITTGMGIRTSDVDCYVHLPNTMELKKPIVLAARNLLRKYPHIFQKLFAVVAAKVPIVKLLHVPTNRNCDVNFTSMAGVRNSKLLAYLLHLDGRALNLAILIKYWSKVHEFTGTNLMPSYALTLLILFYLQEIKVLPPIKQLQQNVPCDIIEYWNTAFDGKMSYISFNNKPLYHLIGGFFKYYSNFKFSENIVSLYEGRAINKKDFENIDTVPNTYQLYRENVRNDICKPLRIDTIMCVQDPFEHSRNTAVAVFPKLAERVLGHFGRAAKAYEEETKATFLKVLLTRDKNEEHLVTSKKNNNKPGANNRKYNNKVTKRNKPQNKKVKNHFSLIYEEIRRKAKS